MNAPAEAFRCQALAKEIAAELRAKYDLKAACLPVNVCLLRSSIMIRAAPWEVLGTSAAAGRSARGRSSGCVHTPKPPQRKLQRWRLAHHSTLVVETVTTKPFFREPFTPNGGLVVQSGARSLRHRDAIISLAARYKLPAVYSARDYASVDGLLSYRPDQIGH